MSSQAKLALERMVDKSNLSKELKSFFKELIEKSDGVISGKQIKDIYENNDKQIVVKCAGNETLVLSPDRLKFIDLVAASDLDVAAKNLLRKEALAPNGESFASIVKVGRGTEGQIVVKQGDSEAYFYEDSPRAIDANSLIKKGTSKPSDSIPQAADETGANNGVHKPTYSRDFKNLPFEPRESKIPVTNGSDFNDGGRRSTTDKGNPKDFLTYLDMKAEFGMGIAINDGMAFGCVQDPKTKKEHRFSITSSGISEESEQYGFMVDAVTLGALLIKKYGQDTEILRVRRHFAR